VQNTVKRLAISFGLSEKVFDGGPVCQFSFDKLHSSRQQIPASMAQVIKNSSFMSRLSQQASHGTTYIPGPAGDQNLHKNAVLPKRFSLP
jgi:hypothetical protein